MKSSLNPALSSISLLAGCVANPPSPDTGGQAAFRVRTDFTASLNADQGWAGAFNENVTIHADRPFRVRVEVEQPGAAARAPFRLRSPAERRRLDRRRSARFFPPCARTRTGFRKGGSGRDTRRLEPHPCRCRWHDRGFGWTGEGRAGSGGQGVPYRSLHHAWAATARGGVSTALRKLKGSGIRFRLCRRRKPLARLSRFWRWRDSCEPVRQRNGSRQDGEANRDSPRPMARNRKAKPRTTRWKSAMTMMPWSWRLNWRPPFARRHSGSRPGQQRCGIPDLHRGGRSQNTSCEHRLLPCV